MVRVLLVLVMIGIQLSFVATAVTHITELIIEFNPRRIIIECMAAITDFTTRYWQFGNSSIDFNYSRDTSKDYSRISGLEHACT